MKKYTKIIIVALIVGFWGFGGGRSYASVTTITLTSVGTSPFCSGTNITVTYSSSGTGGSNNTYFAQLSNDSFVTNVTNIGNSGSLAGSQSAGSTFTATIPLSTATGSYKIRINSANTLACATCSGTISVTINQTPTMTSASSATICSGNTLSIPLTADVGSSFTWIATDNANTTGESTTSQSTGTLSNVITNTTTSVQNVTYTVTPTSTVGSCLGTTQTVTVTVNPKPTMTSASVATICSGGTVSIPLTADVASSFTWIATDNANTTGESVASQSTSTLNNTITNNTTSSQAVTYTVTPTSTVGTCPGTTQTVTVTVVPPVTMSSSNAQTICSGGTASIVLAANVASSFTWIATDNANTTGESTTSQSTGTLSNVITNNTTSVQSVTYTVTPTSTAGSCLGTTQTVTVTVNPKPTMTSASSATICSGNTVSIPLTADVGSSFTWIATNNANTTGESTTSQSTSTLSNAITNNTTSIQNVTYTVTPTSTVGSCLGTTQTVTVTVNPKPTMTSASAATICSGGTVSIPLTADLASSFTWIATDNTNTTGESTTLQSTSTLSDVITNNITSSQAVTYSVTPTSTVGSCSGTTQNVTVTVVPPVTMSSSNSQTICSGGTASIVLAANVASSFTWIATDNANTTGESTTSQSTGTLSNVITNNTTSVQSVTYTVTPTSTAGSCLGTTQTVTVTVNPKPTMTSASSATICSGNTVSIPLTADVGSSFTWIATNNANTTGESTTSQSTSTLSNAITNNTTSIQNVTYTVTPTSTVGSCLGTTQTVTVTVNPKPTMTSASAATICSGGTVSIPLTADLASSFTWIATDNTNTTGESTTLQSTSTLSDVITNNITSSQAVTYSVTPTSTVGSCAGTTQTVTVTVVPPVTMSSSNSQTICSGGTASIVLAANVASSFTWIATDNVNTTGESTTSQSTSTLSNVIINNSASVQSVTYTVTPTSTVGSCLGTTQTVTVTVNPKPVITAQTASTCSGTAFTVSPVDASPVTIVPTGTTYTWTSPTVTGGITGGSAQGTGQASISQTLTNPTNVNQTATYTVTPTSGASGSCVGSTFTIVVTVNPKPVIPNQTPAAICNGTAFSVTPVNAGAVIVPGGTTYTWTSPTVTGGITGGSVQATGQASVSQTLTNPTNTTQTATYSVTPTSGTSGNCVGSTFTTTVTLNPTPTITLDFSASDSVICSGSAGTITFTTGPNNVSGTGFNWTRDNTSNVTGTNSQNGISSSPPLNVVLTNTTNTTQPTNFTITPVFSGCSGTSALWGIDVNPKPAIPNQTQTTCSGTAFTVSPANGIPTSATIIPAGTTYTWTNPLGTGGVTGGTGQNNQTLISQTLTNPTNINQTETYTVTPTSGTSGNCVGSTFTVTVTVNPKPAIPAQTATICSGTSFSISPANGVPTAATIVPTGTTYSWTAPAVTGGITGGSAMLGQTSISQTLTNPTNVNQTATYTVTPTSGASGSCIGSTFTVVVTVNPTPVIPAQISTICSGSSFNVSPANGVPSAATIVPLSTTYSWSAPTVTGGITGGSLQTNQSSISQTLINPTNLVQTATYTVTPTSGTSGSCIGSTFTVTVTVNPSPVIPAQTSIACSGSAFAVSPTNGVPTAATIVPTGTTYTWTTPTVTGAITGGSAQLAGQASISQTLTNPTNINQTATYTVTPTSGASGSCVGSTFTVVVTVNPKPVIPNQTSTICSGSAFTVSPSNGVPSAATIVPAGTTYTWTTPTVTGGIVGGSAQITGQPSVTQILTNPTNTVQTATYTVTPTSGASGNCIGSTFTITVTVNPTPVIPNQTSTICSGGLFTITPANGGAIVVPAGTTYTWTTPTVTGGVTGGTAQVTGQSAISQILTNPTNITQLVTYTVTPTSGSAGSCVGSTFTVSVTVNPAPVIPAQTTSTCSGVVFIVSPSNGIPTAATIVPSNTTYTWNNPVVTGGITGGSAQGTAQNAISQTLTNPTNTNQTATYTVTPISGASGSCVGSTFSLTVTLNSGPVIPNQTQAICSGSSFSVGPVNGGTTIVPAGTTYTWTTPAFTGGITGGSAQVTGVASISQALVNPTNLVQTATYTVTPNAPGCTGATFTVVISVNPMPSISNQTSTTCSGSTFTVNPLNGGSTIVPAGTTYSWSAPTVSGGITGGSALAGQASISQILTNPTNTFQIATYTVTPTSGATGNCVGSTFTVTVTVNPTPVIPNQTPSTCSGSSFIVSPTNGGAIVVPSGTTYAWGAPSVTGGITGGSALTGQASISQTLTNPTNIAQTATYTVTPTSGTSGNCAGSTFTVIVTVNPKPVIANQTSIICSGATFTITPANGGATIVPAGTTYSWSVPTVSGGITGGSAQTNQSSISQTLTNPTNVVQTATYTVTPTSGASGNCVGSTFTVIVTVNTAPVIPNQTTATCSSTAFIVNPSNNPPSTIVPAGTTYTWTAPVVTGGVTGGSGQTNQSSISQMLVNPTNVAQTATYTVTPSSPGCNGSTFTVLVTVNPTPVIQNQTTTTCSGVVFSVSPVNGTPTAATIVPGATTYSWSIPTVTGGITGGSAQTNQTSISQTLVNPTNAIQTATYTVTPTSGVAGSCVGSTFIVTVTLNPGPVIPNQTSAICSGSAFTVSPVNGGATIVPPGTTYTWSTPTVNGGITGGGAQATGQSSISQSLTNPTNIAQTATYTVTPFSGCIGATFTAIVTVNPTPVIPTQNTTICSGTAFIINPVNAQPSTIVPLNTKYTWIAPVVTGGILGGSAQAAQSSTISQTLTNPTNITQTATYTVTPISGDAGNCVGATFTVTVTVNPTPVIPNQTLSICSGTSFTVIPVNAGTTVVPANTTYTWTLPTVTGGITGANAEVVPQNSIGETLSNPTNLSQLSTYTVTPISGDAGNCVGTTFTITVTVNPIPVIPDKVTTICSGTTFTINPLNSGLEIVPTGTTYSWLAPTVTGGIIGGSAQTGISNIFQTLTNPTNIVQTATYTVTPTSGATGSCVGSVFSVTVTVNPTPVLPNQTATICGDSTFSISPSNGGTTIIPNGTTYAWTIPTVSGGVTGGSSQSGQTIINSALFNPTNIPQTATYTVTPTSGAAGSCVGSTFITSVTVNPTPVVPAQVSTICSSSSFNINPLNSQPTTIIPINTGYTWTLPSVTGGITGGNAQAISQNTISETLVNPTNIAQTATYTVTPTSGDAGSCVGSTFTITVTVNTTPVIPDQSDTICSGTSFTINPVNNQPLTIVPFNTKYTWSSPSVTGGITGGTAQLVPQSFISQTLTNPTNIVQTATYTVTPISGQAGSCVGSVFIITVIVNPTPVIAAQTSTICSQTAFSVFPINSGVTIVPAGTKYTWLAQSSTVNIFGDTTQTIPQDTITQNLTNLSNIVQTTTYTVTPTSGTSGSCVGSTFTITVNVNPTPVVPTQADTICSISSFSITPVNTPPTTIIPLNTTYTWSVPTPTGGVTGGSAQTIGIPPPISQTLINPTNLIQTVTYIITPTSGAAGGCVGSDFNTVIRVNPTPVIPSRLDSVCSESPFIFNPANAQPVTIIPSGITYTWSLPAITPIGSGISQTSTGTAQNSFSQTLKNNNTSSIFETAIYTILPTAGLGVGGCIGAPFSDTLVVRPRPAFPTVSDSTNFLSNPPYQVVTTLCGGSTNISLNVNNPVPGAIYYWLTSPDNAFIRRDTLPNTVVSFKDSSFAYTATITVQAEYPQALGGCQSIVSSYPINIGAGNAIEEQKILPKQPGNLLWYPDNTVDSYKWGYDSILNGEPHIPKFINGQIYQVLVPRPWLINNNTGNLDTINHWFWVIVYKGSCESKIYYNGKYALRNLISKDFVPEVLSADIYPNPNNGIFNLVINGNVFGDIKVKIINTLGQNVFLSSINKVKGIESYPIQLPELERGMYMIELNGKYDEHIISKLIITK